MRSCRVSRYDLAHGAVYPMLLAGKVMDHGSDGTVASGDGEIVRSDYDSAL